MTVERGITKNATSSGDQRLHQSGGNLVWSGIIGDVPGLFPYRHRVSTRLSADRGNDQFHRHTEACRPFLDGLAEALPDLTHGLGFTPGGFGRLLADNETLACQLPPHAVAETVLLLQFVEYCPHPLGRSWRQSTGSDSFGMRRFGGAEEHRPRPRSDNAVHLEPT